MENIRQQITDQIVAQIQNGTPPWRKGWSSQELHKNSLTGAVYKGVNQIILSMTPYSDPRWLTWKQAETLGVKVKKASKGHRIVKMVEVDRNRAASVQDGEVLAEDKGKSLVKRGYIDHTMYSTSSMLRTMELILGIPPMSQYDAAATPMWRCFSKTPIISHLQL